MAGSKPEQDDESGDEQKLDLRRPGFVFLQVIPVSTGGVLHVVFPLFKLRRTDPIGHFAVAATAGNPVSISLPMLCTLRSVGQNVGPRSVTSTALSAVRGEDQRKATLNSGSDAVARKWWPAQSDVLVLQLNHPLYIHPAALRRGNQEQCV